MEFTLLTTGVASIQILILVTWFIVENPTVDKMVMEDHVFNACDILIQGNIFFGLVYPFLIIIICTVLATINRNVPTGFRETLFIGELIIQHTPALPSHNRWRPEVWSVNKYDTRLFIMENISSFRIYDVHNLHHMALVSANIFYEFVWRTAQGKGIRLWLK